MKMMRSTRFERSCGFVYCCVLAFVFDKRMDRRELREHPGINGVKAMTCGRGILSHARRSVELPFTVAVRCVAPDTLKGYPVLVIYSKCASCDLTACLNSIGCGKNLRSTPTLPSHPRILGLGGALLLLFLDRIYIDKVRIFYQCPPFMDSRAGRSRRQPKVL